MSEEKEEESSRPPEAIIDDFKSVIASSIAGNVQVASRIRDMLVAATDRSGGSTTDEQQNGKRTDLTRVLDFTLGSIRLFNEHSLQVMNGLLDEVESNLLGKKSGVTASQVAEPTETGAVEIVLKGHRGSVAGAAFLMENSYDHPIELTFEAGELFTEGLPSVSPSVVHVDPQSVSVPAKGQVIVKVGIQLVAEFEAGRQYVGALRTLGYESRMIRLRLDVLPEAPSETAASPSAPKVQASVRKSRVKTEKK
jgi:hypothetical protein